METRVNPLEDSLALFEAKNNNSGSGLNITQMFAYGLNVNHFYVEDLSSTLDVT